MNQQLLETIPLSRVQNQVHCRDQRTGQRYQPIDVFRGLAILGMVFFTVTLRLSSDLPDPLRHNVWGSIHVGDFILPMFLFASGLSLAFYLQKNLDQNKGRFVQNVIGRFSKLAFVGIALSLFSANGLLEMDEVMLSALLFLMSVVLARFQWKLILGIIFCINLSYLALIHFELVPIFIGHYLGGYPAALYYLPLMLVGLVIGKGIQTKGIWCTSNQIVISTIFVFFLLFTIMIPLNKMTATPSFIMLSILVSVLTFAAVEKITSWVNWVKKIAVIGKKPLRYWITMYCVFLIPLWLYIEFSHHHLPLMFPWYVAIGISGGLMILLYILDILFEHITLSN